MFSDYSSLNLIKATVHELPTLHLLTLILLTWRIWWAPKNASKWQMGFNSAFKGLIAYTKYTQAVRSRCSSVRKVTTPQSWICHRHTIAGSDLPVSQSIRNMSVPSRLPHLGGKAAGLEANHSTPSNSEVINEWIYNATAKFAFIV